ncbi:hypothetical protein F2P81_015330 [Scophthalmus maximus]|uniref:Uncharacterized protein n=1 Tax=Scophthalmus maximus TaxID=52904 RepID=A0A6A4SMB5_SCOMX|nr:hypothetical protein F2P81_015330 [Scophthalmus maximus]
MDATDVLTSRVSRCPPLTFPLSAVQLRARPRRGSAASTPRTRNERIGGKGEKEGDSFDGALPPWQSVMGSKGGLVVTQAGSAVRVLIEMTEELESLQDGDASAKRQLVQTTQGNKVLLSLLLQEKLIRKSP